MTVYITPRLLNYHSFNAFGIVIKALGILLCNCCVSFIDLIMWFVQRLFNDCSTTVQRLINDWSTTDQRLINGWHWWLWSSRFLFYCALSRSPPDIPVVISKNNYWSWFVRMPSECCAFIESGYSRASVWLFKKDWNLLFSILAWYLSDYLNIGNSVSYQSIWGHLCQGKSFAFDSFLTL